MPSSCPAAPAAGQEFFCRDKGRERLKAILIDHQDKTYTNMNTDKNSQRDDLTSLQSPHSFADTVQRLLNTFTAHRITVFARIDQQAAAQAAGLEMYPATLILFGNPRAGTPLMLVEPLVGLDLPLKVLVSEHKPGTVMVSFNRAQYLVRRHGLAPELAANIAPAETLVARALGDA